MKRLDARFKLPWNRDDRRAPLLGIHQHDILHYVDSVDVKELAIGKDVFRHSFEHRYECFRVARISATAMVRELEARDIEQCAQGFKILCIISPYITACHVERTARPCKQSSLTGLTIHAHQICLPPCPTPTQYQPTGSPALRAHRWIIRDKPVAVARRIGVKAWRLSYSQVDDHVALRR